MSKESWESSQKVGDALKLKKVDAVIMYKEGRMTAAWYGEQAKGALSQYRKMKDLASRQNAKVKKTTAHPDFSVDMNTAWVLVTSMANKGYSLFYDKNDFSISFISDMVNASSDINSGTFCSSKLRTPTAILIAAAMALGVYSD